MSEIVTQAEAHISELYDKKWSKDFSFHSFKHIKRTLDAANEIAQNSSVKGEDFEILNLAVLFHDVGHMESYLNHEKKSIEIADQFLSAKKYPLEKKKKVFALIEITNLEKTPQNLMENIIRDADIIHLGKKSFFKRNRELRKEWDKILKKSYSDLQWVQSDVKFFDQHGFFTDYAQAQFGEQRLINYSILLEKESRMSNPLLQSNTENEDEASMAKKVAKKIKTRKTPDRGIETMFRLTSKNHFTLSSIADSKASTLISISALIISIILSVLVSRLSEGPELIVPTIFILITLMGTIIFAVISTRPKVTSFQLSRDDVTEKKGNLLFFGNFISMPVEDYEWGMREVMNDREYLYNNLIRDIYYLGVVLGKKYRYLRIAYNFFMYGLIISVIAYIIAFSF
jgi:predicted metal-dependent HD superfamily phosphohydrolase